jgi:hypothetical protein
VAGTLNIPLTSLAVGTRSFGPANVGANDSGVQLNIDRSVANGLTATSATSIGVDIEISLDGGVNWMLQGHCTFVGGVRTDLDTGQTVLNEYIFIALMDSGNPNRRIRATLTVSGSTVSVAGSLIVT